MQPPAPFIRVETDAASGCRSVHATRSFAAGDIICNFSAGEIVANPNRLTLQVDVNRHITLQPDALQFTNHSCAPNVFFDTANGLLLALHDISEGDELTFFYPSTEWMMAEPFQCCCGYAGCIGEIRGAALMDAAILRQYRLNAFILQQLQQKARQRA